MSVAIEMREFGATQEMIATFFTKSPSWVRKEIWAYLPTDLRRRKAPSHRGGRPTIKKQVYALRNAGDTRSSKDIAVALNTTVSAVAQATRAWRDDVAPGGNACIRCGARGWASNPFPGSWKWFALSCYLAGGATFLDISQFVSTQCLWCNCDIQGVKVYEIFESGLAVKLGLDKEVVTRRENYRTRYRDRKRTKAYRTRVLQHGGSVSALGR